MEELRPDPGDKERGVTRPPARSRNDWGISRHSSGPRPTACVAVPQVRRATAAGVSRATPCGCLWSEHAQDTPPQCDRLAHAPHSRRRGALAGIRRARVAQHHAHLAGAGRSGAGGHGPGARLGGGRGGTLVEGGRGSSRRVEQCPAGPLGRVLRGGPEGRRAARGMGRAHRGLGRATLQHAPPVRRPATKNQLPRDDRRHLPRGEADRERLDLGPECPAVPRGRGGSRSAGGEGGQLPDLEFLTGPPHPAAPPPATPRLLGGRHQRPRAASGRPVRPRRRARREASGGVVRGRYAGRRERDRDRPDDGRSAGPNRLPTAAGSPLGRGPRRAGGGAAVGGADLGAHPRRRDPESCRRRNCRLHGPRDHAADEKLGAGQRAAPSRRCRRPRSADQGSRSAGPPARPDRSIGRCPSAHRGARARCGGSPASQPSPRSAGHGADGGSREQE